MGENVSTYFTAPIVISVISAAYPDPVRISTSSWIFLARSFMPFSNFTFWLRNVYKGLSISIGISIRMPSLTHFTRSSRNCISVSTILYSKLVAVNVTMFVTQISAKPSQNIVSRRETLFLFWSVLTPLKRQAFRKIGKRRWFGSIGAIEYL